MAQLQLVYLDTESQTYKQEQIEFSVAALQQLSLDSDTTTLVGAEIKRPSSASFDAVPETAGGDASALILRLVTAMAPSREAFTPGSSNPKLHESVGIYEAFQAGSSHASSGLYYALATTSDPPTFEALRMFLATFLDAETTIGTSPRVSTKYFGIPESSGILKGGQASKLLGAVVASACTTSAAYVRSSESDARWIGAVVRHLERTLLPLVAFDRYSLLSPTRPSTNSPGLRQKNQDLIKMLNQTPNTFTSGSILEFVNHMYTTIKSLDVAAAVAFFELDQAPVYYNQSATTHANIFSTSDLSPPDLCRIFGTSTAWNATVSDLEAESMKWNEKLTIQASPTSNVFSQESSLDLESIPPHTTENGDTFTFQVVGNRVNVERTPASDSDRPVGWDSKFEVDCITMKTAPMIEASLFLEAHKKMIQLFSSYCDDIAFKKL